MARVYAQHVTLTDSRLRWDELRWYSGKAARARCAKLGEQSQGAWCYEYFFEKTARKGSGAITADTAVRLLDENGELNLRSPAQLAPALRADDWPYYRIWRSADTINQIEQVFTP